MGQIQLLLEKAHKLSEEWGNIPTLIGGDLNSMLQSALYQFLASAELDIQLHERRKICGQNCSLEFPSFQSWNRGTTRMKSKKQNQKEKVEVSSSTTEKNDLSKV
ncbi:hypothetical protein LguiA_001783 [Lonicera macranthoides]